MPAYWSLNIDSALVKTPIRRFYDVLGACGVAFEKGTGKSENFPFEQIVKCHEEYAKEPRLSDGSLYQELFAVEGFSEVRGYWHMDRWDMDGIGRYTLLIPEDDFLNWDSGAVPGTTEFHNMTAMDKVKGLALQLWEKLDLLAIQTAWECSDTPCSYAMIKKQGRPPQAEPFAILDGHLVENKDNWLYV